jgi:hypothetical protein
MAQNGTSTTTRKPAARKRAATKRAATKRAATKRTARSTATRSTTTRSSTARGTTARSTTGAPSGIAGRRRRIAAARTTREAASANAAAARTTAAQGRNLIERAALVGVGATVETRDRVLELAGDLVGRYGTRTGVQRELKRSRGDIEKDIRKFERKGNTTRNQLERDVRKARTRLERQLRTRRRDAVATLSNSAQGAVQLGVVTGSRFATLAKERMPLS